MNLLMYLVWWDRPHCSAVVMGADTRRLTDRESRKERLQKGVMNERGGGGGSGG